MVEWLNDCMTKSPELLKHLLHSLLLQGVQPAVYNAYDDKGEDKEEMEEDRVDDDGTNIDL